MRSPAARRRMSLGRLSRLTTMQEVLTKNKETPGTTIGLGKISHSSILRLWKISVLLTILILLLSGCTDKKLKIYRVGMICGLDRMAPIADGFKAKMTELGYVEGKNIIYYLKNMAADSAGERLIAEKFVADRVDLIVAFPTEPAVAAKAAVRGTKIPVIFANAGIEGTDLVTDIRNPGGNLTGVRFPGPDITIKRFEFLMDMAPKIRRIYIPYDPGYPNNLPALTAIRPVASSKAITLVEKPITAIKDLRADLERRRTSKSIGMDAVMIMPEILMQSPHNWAIIRKFAEEFNLPIAGAAAPFANQGALFSYAPTPFEIGTLAATQADKIFNGIPAGTIPVFTPECHLRINYRVAQRLGLNVPDGVLRMADEVIR
jgi:putative tryptophan/tyrosine transport system substrate-binding protein